jgi:hypothetical protein
MLQVGPEKQVKMKLTSFAVVGLDGQLQGRDVPEGEQEEHDQVPLVLYGSYLKQQP